jgi:hypothetical protein
MKMKTEAKSAIFIIGGTGYIGGIDPPPDDGKRVSGNF